MSSQIDDKLVYAVIELAEQRGTTVSSMTLDEIANGLGVSRMTLHRRIGNRSALHDAVAARGLDPGEEPGARERILDAAATLIRRDGLGPLTLEAVAIEAGCRLPTVFAIFGNRRGLLMETFARHIDIRRIAQAFEASPADDPASLFVAVKRVYMAVTDVIEPELPMIRALAAEALRDPGGDAGAYITTRHMPAIATYILPWISSLRERGVIRDVPLSIAIQQFIGPMAAHILSRPLFESQGFLTLPNRDEACDLLARQFCRAMALDRTEDNDGE